ncbi:hypothetical protein BX616_002867 [Lobosporangium transversale]|nr:hypothetical protein BX616_002867 [Lobosporangium transversale]
MGPGQDQPRESHLISLKVMRLSRPSLVTGHSLYFGSPHGKSNLATETETTLQTVGGARPNMTSILTNALTELSHSQLERVHPPSPAAKVIHPTSSLEDHEETDEALDMGDFGVSELLTMPASFGNIYLGETFTSYICANNESAHPVRDVILKAELQTSTLRFALSDTLSNQQRHQAPNSKLSQDTSSPHLQQQQQPQSPTAGKHIQLLESGKTNEIIVSHEIKELGTHILVCSIQYTTLDGQQKSFRKFYKFQVMNPLSVKTKVNHPSPPTVINQESNHNGSVSVAAMSASKSGLVLLEAVIQNVSGVTMWIERMRFEVADAFTARDLNVVIEDDDDEDDDDEDDDDDDDDATKINDNGTKDTEQSKVSIFGEHDYFAPNDVRQYLYVLTPKPGKELLAKTTNILGKMDILWRSQFGETGRLQTSQLTRKPVPLDEIAVQVVKIPERIYLEEVFTMEIVIKNQSLGGSTAAQQQQQQQQYQSQSQSQSQTQSSQNQSNQPQPGQISRSSSTQFSGRPASPSLGILAKPPAAVARGGVVPTNRSFDTSSGQSSQQQQQQQPQQHQQHPQPSLAQDQNSMKLILTGVKQKMGAVLLSGPNSRQLGAVPAGGEVRVRLDWFPLVGGVQKIGGIRIVDIISGYTVEVDHLTNCFVEHT